MKKKFFTLFLLIFLTFTFFNINVYAKENIDENYIYEILKGEAYSYLNDEAKDFIVDVYKETGEVLLTEKNKKDGMIYINPDFIEYLGLSDEEKAKYQIIPDVYLTAQKQTHLDDYTPAFKGGNRFGSMLFSNSLLPSSFDFRNVDGKNYLTPLKNQGSLGLCWAFASVENAETYLMYNKKQSYNPSTTETFSIRQMDYATSSNGLRFDAGSSTYTFTNIYNAFRELGDGGHFFGASLAMMNGITLTDESVVPWNESKYTYHRPEKILNFEQSKYEVDSTINLEALSTSSSLTKRYEMVEKVKNYMIKYGAPSVGTYSPQGSCAFKNKDGKYVLKVDECYNPSDGHAMQIIGWDDNYSYDYCDYGSYHLSATNGTCSLGSYTTGKGAWIIRNSWGDNTDYKYVYLTYDSTQYDVGFITSLKKMDNRSWDNNYHDMPLTLDGRYSRYSSDSKTFYTRNDKKEKIEKIKFLSKGTNSTFTLNVYSSESNYNITKTLFVEEPGVVTFDLSNDNILVEDSFYVEVTSDTSYSIVIDSLAAFTSNLDNEPSANYYNIANSSAPISETNPLLVNDYTGNKWFVEFLYFPKNFDIDTKPEYRLSKDDKVYNKFGNSIFYYQLDDKGNVDFTTSTLTNYNDGINTFSMKDAYCKNYNLDVLYNGSVIESLPIKFACEDGTYKYEIKLNANNGNDYSVSNMYLESSIVSLRNISLDKEEMFNDGYYITGWNTKADGSGTSYDLNASITLSADVELYAMWSSEKLSTNVVYNDNCDNCTGTINNQVVVYGNDIDLMHNAYEKEGSKFLYWSLTSQIPNDLNYYYDFENIKYEDVIKYPIYNNETLNLYAIWSSDYSKVSFDANGGNGSMNEFYVQNSKDSKLLKNTFTKEDHYFVEWNTKADGSGTSYKDGLPINVSEDTILYAQWEKPKFNISVIGGTANVELSVKNETITISADLSLEDERMFDKWIVKTDGVVLSSLTTPTSTFTMPEYDVEIEAKYKYYLDVPAPKKDSYEYNGKEQSLLFDNFDSEKLNITNNIGTEIKSYTAVVSIKDKENYIWRDKTNTDKNISWSIVKINVEKPTVENVDFTYNGKEQTLNIKGFDSELMNVSVNKATEIGKYTAVISLKDKEHYNWSDKTTNDISINWNINKILVEKPTVENVEFIYNTKEHTLSIDGFDPELMNVTGNKATNVGKYTAVISLKDKNHYSWKDKTDTDISIKWNVSKLLVKKPTIETNKLVFNSKDLILNIKDLNLDVMNVSGNKAKIVGDYTAIISLKDINNYAWIDNSVDDISIEWSIVWPENKIAIVDPSLVNDTYYYDGNEITVNVKDLDEDFVTVSGITETNIGEYKAVFSLKDKGHYSWSNGSSDDIEYTWSIVVGTPKLSKSVQYNSIKLSWNSVKDAKYTIYNCDSKGKKCKTIGSTTNTSYTIKSLSYYKSYYYKVKISFKIGEDSYSSTSNLYGVKTTLATPTITATTDNYQYTKLSWTKISGASKYYVYRCSSSGSSCSLIKTTKSTSYTYTGGTEGYAYKYKVKAYRSGSYSSYSPSVTGMKLKDGISFSLTKPSYRKINVSISHLSTAKKYYIYRATSKNGKYSLIATIEATGETLNYLDTVSFNKTYYYKIKANNGVNSTAYTSYKYTTANTMDKPVITSVSNNRYQNTIISWNKVNGATSYNVYRCSSTGSDCEKIANTKSTSYTTTGGSEGVTYMYKVRPYVGSTAGITSDGMTGMKVKDSISFSVSNTGYKEITVTINNTTPGAVKYKIYRATSKSGKYSYIGYVDANADKLTYVNKSLSFNKTYYYKVIASSNVNSSASSGYKYATTSGLAKPTVTTELLEDNKMKFTTNKVSGATGYEYYYSTDGKTYKLLSRTTSLSLTKTFSYRKYYLRVRSYLYSSKKYYYSSYTTLEPITFVEKLKGISLSGSSTISVDETKKIEVKYNPSHIRENVIWTSSDDSIASVREGYVTGHKEGSVKITATSESGFTASINIFVYVPTSSLEVDKTNVTMYLGDSVTINATILPSNATYKTLTWSSSNTSIVTVDNGIITGVGYGDAIVTVRNQEGRVATTYVTVKEKPIEFSGYGDYVTGTFDGTGEMMAFTINMTADSINEVKVYEYGGESYDYDSLVIESDPYSGTTAAYLEKGKKYYFVVETNGYWDIEVNRISGQIYGNYVNGYGDTVTGLIEGTGEMMTFTINMNADSINEVKVYEYGGGLYDYQSLALESDPYSGTTAAYLEKGKKYFFVVETEGNWSIQINHISGQIYGTSVTGYGNTVTGLIEGTGKMMAFTINMNADSINEVKVYEYGGGLYDYQSLALESDPYSGTTAAYLEKGKKYFFVVETEGNWSIQINNISGTLSGNSVSGYGDSVTGVFTASSNSMNFSVIMNADTINSIKVFEYGGGLYDYERLVYESDPYSGSKLIYLTKGKKYFFVVETETGGYWQISW